MSNRRIIILHETSSVRRDLTTHEISRGSEGNRGKVSATGGSSQGSPLNDITTSHSQRSSKTRLAQHSPTPTRRHVTRTNNFTRTRYLNSTMSQRLIFTRRLLNLLRTRFIRRFLVATTRILRITTRNTHQTVRLPNRTFGP